jgi:hypothetical protein
MLNVKPKQKQAVRDMLAAGQYPLWPDKESGLLILPPRLTERLSALRLPRSRHLPRAVTVTASRLLRSQSLWSWLLLKSLGAVGWHMVKESLFETWLTQALSSAEYNALEVDLVLKSAVEELRLDLQTAKRILVTVTARGGKFKSVDGLITIR